MPFIEQAFALDSIIHYYMDMYMEMDKEFRRYGKEMYLCNVDSDVEDPHGRFRNGNIVLQNYHGIGESERSKYTYSRLGYVARNSVHLCTRCCYMKG